MRTSLLLIAIFGLGTSSLLAQNIRLDGEIQYSSFKSDYLERIREDDILSIPLGEVAGRRTGIDLLPLDNPASGGAPGFSGRIIYEHTLLSYLDVFGGYRGTIYGKKFGYDIISFGTPLRFGSNDMTRNNIRMSDAEAGVHLRLIDKLRLSPYLATRLITQKGQSSSQTLGLETSSTSNIQSILTTNKSISGDATGALLGLSVRYELFPSLYIHADAAFMGNSTGKGRMDEVQVDSTQTYTASGSTTSNTTFTTLGYSAATPPFTASSNRASLWVEKAFGEYSLSIGFRRESVTTKYGPYLPYGFYSAKQSFNSDDSIEFPFKEDFIGDYYTYGRSIASSSSGVYFGFSYNLDFRDSETNNHTKPKDVSEKAPTTEKKVEQKKPN